MCWCGMGSLFVMLLLVLVLSRNPGAFVGAVAYNLPISAWARGEAAKPIIVGPHSRKPVPLIPRVSQTSCPLEWFDSSWLHCLNTNQTWRPPFENHCEIRDRNGHDLKPMPHVRCSYSEPIAEEDVDVVRVAWTRLTEKHAAGTGKVDGGCWSWPGKAAI